ncbi:MAG: DNA polymerase domain-containing protein [Candidatus Bathyarchaeota archaeon]
MNGSTPVVRIFGKTKEGKTVCAFDDTYKPYFYAQLVDVQPNGRDPKEEFVEFLKSSFGSLLLSVDFMGKFLPIGFRQQQSEVAKITITEPSRVPEIRDELRKKKFVKEIFEADILFKYRYMVDKGISGMNWIEMEGTPSTTGTVKTNYKINVSKITPVERHDDAELKHMAIDIETTSEREGLPDATRDEISMISMAFSPNYKSQDTMVFMAKRLKDNGDNSVKSFSSEKDMLEEFSRVMSEFDPDTIIGYNINGFDMPYLAERYRQNRMQCLLGRCSKKSVICRSFGMINRSDVIGRVVVDAYELIKANARVGLMKLKRYGLGDVSQELLGEDKVDVAHSEITKYWKGTDEQLKKLIEYNRKDSILAMRLVLEKNLLDKFIELSKVSGVLLQDALSSGEASRIENLLLKEFNSRDYIVPCKPTTEETSRRRVERETRALKGAIVLEPETGLHKDCVVYMDFKSLYPSIYIAYNICPTTLLFDEHDLDTIETPYGARFVSKKVKKGILPEIVETLIKDRDIVKKEMNAVSDKEKRRQLNAKQVALKIMANAFYGYTGYIRAKLYVLDIANGITSCGRDLIQRTRDTVDDNTEYTVIYGDTDSVMVKTKTTDIEEAYKIGYFLENHINEALENIVTMKIECVFKTMIILTKKRYAGWSFEKIDSGMIEKLVMKGIETVRRDWCELVSKTLYTVLEIILKEQDPKKAFDYVREVLKKLQRNEIPIEDLIITKSVSRPISSYKGIQPHIEVVKKMRRRNPNEAHGVGDRVGFVITQGLQMLSSRAEDPEYVKKRGIKVDSKYYIENQLLPPLERVFEAMGIEKSELLGEGKQMNLMSMLSGSSSNGNQSTDTLINSLDGLICNKCQKTYERPPLLGRCKLCNGDLVFYKGTQKAKYYISE